MIQCVQATEQLGGIAPQARNPDRRRVVAAAMGSLVVAPTLAAEPAWPQRPIRWLVPYGAGTAPDSTVRTVAEALAPLLKQPVIVENKAGAAGNLGAQLVAQAKPDGYTWIYTASPMAGNMRMYRTPGFNALKDFRHVSRIATSDLMVVVPKQSRINNLQDLVATLRKRPDALNYGSGGVGTPAHLGVEMFLNLISAKAVHVPFKSAAEVVTAIVSGQIDFAFPVTSVAMNMLSQGRLKALAVSGPQRGPQIPQVPTLKESGVALSLVSFGGVSVPAGTPEPIVQRLNQAMHEVLEKPSVRGTLFVRGAASVAASSPEVFTEDIVQEMALTQRMMAIARIEPQ